MIFIFFFENNNHLNDYFLLEIFLLVIKEIGINLSRLCYCFFETFSKTIDIVFLKFLQKKIRHISDLVILQ